MMGMQVHRAIDRTARLATRRHNGTSASSLHEASQHANTSIIEQRAPTSGSGACQSASGTCCGSPHCSQPAAKPAGPPVGQASAAAAVGKLAMGAVKEELDFKSFLSHLRNVLPKPSYSKVWCASHPWPPVSLCFGDREWFCFMHVMYCAWCLGEGSYQSVLGGQAAEASSGHFRCCATGRTRLGSIGAVVWAVCAEVRARHVSSHCGGVLLLFNALSIR